MRRNLSITEWIKLFAMSFLVVFASAASTQATVLYVDGSRPSSGTGLSWVEAYKTIQEAVDAAAAGDEIWVRQGTYGLVSPIDLSKSVDLFGGFDGSELDRAVRNWANNATIIDGQGTTGCFTVTADIVLDGFTVTNGRRAVTISYTSTPRINPIIANCTFTENSALEGGAIQIYSRVFLQLINCWFENNTATWTSGGAIHNDIASLLIQQCFFISNRALQEEGNIKNGGGAIFNDGQYGTPYCDIASSVFLYNFAQEQGGAVGNFEGAVTNIVNSSFIENEATGANGGGAVYNSNSSISINFCDFIGNSTVYGGGAINNSDSLAVITNSSFIENQAGYVGGAIWNWQYQTADPPKILNCLFSDNSTDGDGGQLIIPGRRPTSPTAPFTKTRLLTAGVPSSTAEKRISINPLKLPTVFFGTIPRPSLRK